MVRSSPAEPLPAGARYAGLTIVRALTLREFASSYEARDQGGSRVHLKRYDAHAPDSSAGGDLLRAQRALIPVLRRLGAGVGALRRVGEEAGHLYNVSDWVDGRELAASYGELSPAQRLACAQQLSGTVARLHDEGVAHRDLKPANLLVVNRSRLVIVDFDGASVGPHTGVPLSSPPYAAPEHHGLHRPDDARRGDVFTLGLVLYELLSGWFPFAAEDVYERGEFCARRFLIAVERGVPTLEDDLRGAPPRLISLLERSLHLDPARRPSAAALAAAVAGLRSLAT